MLATRTRVPATVYETVVAFGEVAIELGRRRGEPETESGGFANLTDPVHAHRCSGVLVMSCNFVSRFLRGPRPTVLDAERPRPLMARSLPQ